MISTNSTESEKCQQNKNSESLNLDSGSRPPKKKKNGSLHNSDKTYRVHKLNCIIIFVFFLFLDEVERLLRDYKQNQDFIRNLGNRFYQIIYPIQVRQREKFGVSTREIEGSYGKVSDKLFQYH